MKGWVDPTVRGEAVTVISVGGEPVTGTLGATTRGADVLVSYPDGELGYVRESDIQGVRTEFDVPAGYESPRPAPDEEACYCGKAKSVCLEENGAHCHHPFAHAHMWGD